MISDSLKGFERYIKLHPRFEAAYDFIRKTDFSTMETGEYTILKGDKMIPSVDGPVAQKEIYCTIWEGDGKGLEIPQLEVHDSYIDVHILIEGSETIGLRDRSKCSGEVAKYDGDKDIAFMEEEPENFINLAPGNFVILFPHDAHAPLIGEGKIKKAVIKILM